MMGSPCSMGSMYPHLISLTHHHHQPLNLIYGDLSTPYSRSINVCTRELQIHYVSYIEQSINGINAKGVETKGMLQENTSPSNTTPLLVLHTTLLPPVPTKITQLNFFSLWKWHLHCKVWLCGGRFRSWESWAKFLGFFIFNEAVVHMDPDPVELHVVVAAWAPTYVINAVSLFIYTPSLLDWS